MLNAHVVPWLLLGSLIAVGCKSAEEKCNESKVSAYDRWSEVASSLEPACGVYRTPEWERIRDRVRESNAGIAFGRLDSGMFSFVMTVSPKWEAVEAACAAVAHASQASRGGAIPFRDASAAAANSLQALHGLIPGLKEQQANTTDGIYAPQTAAAARAVLAVIEPSSFDRRVGAASAASAASWEQCHAVNP